MLSPVSEAERHKDSRDKEKQETKANVGVVFSTPVTEVTLEKKDKEKGHITKDVERSNTFQCYFRLYFFISCYVFF